LVTGAGSGIGAGIALVMAAAGSQVIAPDIDKDAAAATRASDRWGRRAFRSRLTILVDIATQWPSALALVIPSR
jgi:NAD(P)-dependent dehydrogenase (short-subunit alcohol dehydrogenase family)